jgi:hypothetical protein
MRGNQFVVRKYGRICWGVFDRNVGDFVKSPLGYSYGRELIYSTRREARERALELSAFFRGELRFGDLAH